MSTCRFCGTWIDIADVHSPRKVKYGVRHYAHHHCSLDAGKSLADLHPWQVGQFPHGLWRERGLLDEALRLAGSPPAVKEVA